MTRYIDADEFEKRTVLVEGDEFVGEYVIPYASFEMMPTVDAVKVVHAHWKNIGSGHAECSNCGMTVSADYPASPCVHYCANYGARMDEVA